MPRGIRFRDSDPNFESIKKPRNGLRAGRSRFSDLETKAESFGDSSTFTDTSDSKAFLDRRNECMKEIEHSVNKVPSKREMKAFWDEYNKQFNESSGFDIDVRPPAVFHGGAGIVYPQKNIAGRPEYLKHIKALAVSAIETYNKENGAAFKCVQIDKVNEGGFGGISSVLKYITFTAQDVKKKIAGNDHHHEAAARVPFQVKIHEPLDLAGHDDAAALMTFQALVEEYPFPVKDTKVLLCRPKP